MITLLLGVIVGILLTLTVSAIAYVMFRKRASSISKIIQKIETAPVLKEKVSILRRKTDAEIAMESLRELNKDRGGIPDIELHDRN